MNNAYRSVLVQRIQEFKSLTSGFSEGLLNSKGQVLRVRRKWDEESFRRNGKFSEKISVGKLRVQRRNRQYKGGREKVTLEAGSEH